MALSIRTSIVETLSRNLETDRPKFHGSPPWSAKKPIASSDGASSDVESLEPFVNGHFLLHGSRLRLQPRRSSFHVRQ
jgi:hypothetical protein